MAQITGTRFSDDIFGTDSADTIDGREGDDRIWGFGGNDLLIGGSGHDDLDGGSGADRMEGGTGDDLYVVDSTGDQVVELAGEGIDVVLTSLAAYTLGNNVEDLVALSSADFTGTGNALDNFIYGWVGDDILNGAGGDDVMFGDEGDDVYFVDQAGDEVVEYAFEGIDLVFTSLATYTLGDNVEDLIFDGAGAFTGIGNGRDNDLEGAGGNDRLEGRGGDDILNGAGGADTMVGGTGHDDYLVDNAGDVVVENPGEGDDRVFASVSYALAAAASVETLATNNAAGTAAINLTGSDTANSIYGNNGANVLSGGGGNDQLVGLGGNDLLIGGAGADVMRGGAGNDAYRVDDSADRIFEGFGEGEDSVSASASFTLNFGAQVEVLGTVNAAATTAINLTGNDYENSIYGNAGANVLSGDGGADFLNGLEGNDALIGGGGSDVLRGGLGQDEFRFNSSLGSANVDAILDFSVADDTIALDDAVFTSLAPGALPASAFALGTAAGDADDRIIYDAVSGALFFDRDGTGAAAQVQFASVQPGVPLTADDFIVV